MEALRAAGRITDRAIATDSTPGADFSQAIRQGMPGVVGIVGAKATP
jgi:hypothetical protein